jgi:hypothetical protein
MAPCHDDKNINLRNGPHRGAHSPLSTMLCWGGNSREFTLLHPFEVTSWVEG